MFVVNLARIQPLQQGQFPVLSTWLRAMGQQLSGPGVLLFVAAAGLLITGCSGPRASSSTYVRPFDFYTDTFAFPNELVWVYEYDSEGNWTTRKREPKPDYYQHCFVIARVARQFLENARFAPELPIAD